MKIRNAIFSVMAGLLLAGVAPSRAEFLFTDPTGGDFIIPTLGSLKRYSEWRGFYSTSTIGNLPTWYAEAGGASDDNITWYPTAKPPSFQDYPEYYTSPTPNAFWDVRNPTITQTIATGTIGYITGGGNFYGLNGAQSFRLDDNTSLTSDQDGPSHDGYTANTAVFQFQTDGQVTDLSTIRLVYMDGAVEKSLSASDLTRVEYLREYRPPAGGSGNPNADQGYQNRTVLQWDLTGLNISQYSIVWDTASHTSLQRVALNTSDTYVTGIPISHTWTGSTGGSWESGGNWLQRAGNAGYGTTPVTNGNVRFENTGSAAVDISSNHTVGELIFASANDVTLNKIGGAALTGNTGIITTDSATGTYTIKPNYVLGALNMFEINAGTVVMDGVISGNYSLVKQGNGALVLNANNTFNGGLDIHGGEAWLKQANSYTGNTTVRGGLLVVGANGALGVSTGTISIGFDSAFFDSATPAEMVLDGAITMNRSITMVANGSDVILAGRNTGSGQAVYSGSVALAAGVVNLIFRAESATDKVAFTGAITGGTRDRNLTLDGDGTVIYSGSNKTYSQSTVISKGTLLLQSAYTGAGHMTVKNGATLQVSGTIGTSGSAVVTVESGGRLEGSGTIGRRVVTTGLGSTLVADGGLKLSALDATQGITFEFQQPIGEVSPLNIVGLLTSGTAAGSVRFSFLDTDDLEFGVVYNLLTFGSSASLDFTDFSLLNNSGYYVDTSFGTNGWRLDGNTLQVQFVPEPSTYALLAVGSLILVHAYRRRRLA